MSKSILIFIFVLLVGCSDPFATWEKQGKSFNNAIELSKKENKNIILYFHASWCKSCTYFDKNYLKDEKLKKYLDNFIKISIMCDQNQIKEDDIKLILKYKIRQYPTILLLSLDSPDNFKDISPYDNSKFLGIDEFINKIENNLKLLNTKQLVLTTEEKKEETVTTDLNPSEEQTGSQNSSESNELPVVEEKIVVLSEKGKVIAEREVTDKDAVKAVVEVYEPEKTVENNKKGMLFLNNKNYKKAIYHFKQALKYQKESANAYYGLGLCYYETGLESNNKKELELAKKYFKKSLEFGPANEDAKVKIQLIESIK